MSLCGKRAKLISIRCPFVVRSTLEFRLRWTFACLIGSVWFLNFLVKGQMSKLLALKNESSQEILREAIFLSFNQLKKNCFCHINSYLEVLATLALWITFPLFSYFLSSPHQFVIIFVRMGLVEGGLSVLCVFFSSIDWFQEAKMFSLLIQISFNSRLVFQIVYFYQAFLLHFNTIKQTKEVKGLKTVW